MLLKGVDLEMEDYDRRTALHLAAAEGHLDVVEFLVKVGRVRVDPKDRWNRTPLQDAKTENHHHVVAFLRQAMTIGEQEEDDEIDDYGLGTDIGFGTHGGSQNISSASSCSPKTVSESSENSDCENEATPLGFVEDQDVQVNRKQAIPLL